MIDLVLDRSGQNSFVELAKKMNGMIRNTVRSFARDKMLSKIEDNDSLSNLCLLKLNQARQDFVYDSSLTDEHNERRFMSMFKTYIRNILIDCQYSANLSIRKADTQTVSINQPLVVDNDDEDYCFEIRDDNQPQPFQNCIVTEIKEQISNLDGHSLTIAMLMLDGYKAEEIARKTGIPVNRVRYLLYSQIQPEIMSYYDED